MLHKLRSGDAYSIHSPFLFEFYNQTVAYNKYFYPFTDLGYLRADLLKDKTALQIQDLGAGSQKTRSSTRQVKDIVKNSGKQEFVAQFLFRLINHLKPRTSLELGTSLGLTSLYLASVDSKHKVYTLEGCAATRSYAQTLFRKQKKSNITSVLGNIDVVLPEVLKEIQVLDFVFFDANHTYEATIKYFKWCKERAHEGSVFVLDDIYWSPGMKAAWTEICADQDVMISIDFFYFGVLFFRKNQPKQHFYLKI